MWVASDEYQTIGGIEASASPASDGSTDIAEPPEDTAPADAESGTAEDEAGYGHGV